MKRKRKTVKEQMIVKLMAYFGARGSTSSDWVIEDPATTVYRLAHRFVATSKHSDRTVVSLDSVSALVRHGFVVKYLHGIYILRAGNRL